MFVLYCAGVCGVLFIARLGCSGGRMGLGNVYRLSAWGLGAV